METINICIEPNETSVLKRWHNPTFTDNFFKDTRYKIVKWDDIHPSQKNFLFLYLVPDETLMFLRSQNNDFWQTIKKNNIRLLFQNEQFNVFMREGDIFKIHKNLPNGKLDISAILYWQIVELCKSKGIDEKNLHFIHCADGFMQEIQQMKETVIPWLGSTFEIPSKHINWNNSLRWGERTEVIVENQITCPYMCLFAGRPSSHRHDLVKRLWYKNLTRYGKISLSPMHDDCEFADVTFPLIGAGPNQHMCNDGEYNETEVFKDTFLCVVGETYVSNGYAYFTEKTIKPILYERPFISYGNTGTLKYLRDFGFRTFGEFWDESYDEAKDYNEKLDKIENIIHRIANMSVVDLNQMYQQMMPVVKHNKNLLKQTDWGLTLYNFLK